jgi:hypothetical protein
MVGKVATSSACTAENPTKVNAIISADRFRKFITCSKNHSP